MGSMSKRPSWRRVALIGAVAGIITACGGGAASAPTTARQSAAPSAAVSAAPSQRPSGGPSAAAGAIVGEWIGIHDCERIVAMLHAAKADEFIIESVVGNGLIPGVDTEAQLKDPAKPCTGAVQQQHSHYFTADGRFGSKDFDAYQVDDGTYEVKGDTVVINGQPFRFSVDGDQLTLEPPKIDTSSCTSKECRFEAAWVLMVAMPGTTWTRGVITP